MAELMLITGNIAASKATVPKIRKDDAEGKCT